MKTDKLTEILLEYRNNYASLDRDGELWGHDTSLGDGEEELKSVYLAITAYFKERMLGLLPKEKKLEDKESPHIKIGYNQCLAEIRAKIEQDFKCVGIG